MKWCTCGGVVLPYWCGGAFTCGSGEMVAWYWCCGSAAAAAV